MLIVTNSFAGGEQLVQKQHQGEGVEASAQARQNLDNEIPDGTSFAETARYVREAWAEKLDRVQVDGATDDAQTVFYTGIFHSLQVGPVSKIRYRYVDIYSRTSQVPVRTK